MSRIWFFLLGLFTLIGFPAMAWPILELYLETSFLSIFSSRIPRGLEIAFGLGYGLASGIAAWELVKMNFLTETRDFFSGLIGGLRLGWAEIIFISLCAGIGEEVLFRGAVQPVLGIWITSVLFIAMHGYLNPKNWRISVYGLFMCPVIAGLGYLREELGLVAAISAHFMIDVYLLRVLCTHALQRR